MFGRDGRAGGSDELVVAALAVEVVPGNVDVVDEGMPVLAVEHQRGDRIPVEHVPFLPVVPALSHGFGGEAVLISRAMALHEVRFNNRGLCANLGLGDPWAPKVEVALPVAGHEVRDVFQRGLDEVSRGRGPVPNFMADLAKKTQQKNEIG